MTAFTCPVALGQAHGFLSTRFESSQTSWKTALGPTIGQSASEYHQPTLRTRPTIFAVRATPLIFKRPAASKKPTARPKLTAESDSLESTPVQRLLLALQVGLSAAVATQAFVHAAEGGFPAVALHAVLVGVAYLLTDLFVGIYHHAVDNYGSEKTPIMGCKYLASSANL